MRTERQISRLVPEALVVTRRTSYGPPEPGMTVRFRDEIQVMLAPQGTYRRLLQGPLPIGWRAVLGRPALVALVIGAFVTLTNAGQLLPTLLLGTTIAWVWVPALQLALITPFIAFGRRRRRAPLSSAVDLFFVGHGPWSLWLMAVAALMMGRLPNGLSSTNDLIPLLLSALVPILWTSIIVFAFFRVVLAFPIWLALLATALYEAMIWGTAYLYVGAVTFRFRPFSDFAGFFG